ncbi:Osmotin thaumatin-like protein [Ephemerocybe angulata]|uniref:Osmotin thaumatin-like protein n=1 Tax=Ephemerocybe angulata TaxID=980116 RepID=A0A8H6LWV4_9AGAR|nr:Osmotin thaumatin-like protein [Tulosesus angulatus]
MKFSVINGLLALTAATTSAAARQISVVNGCSFTLFTDKRAGGGIPSQATGWIAPPSTRTTFTVPDNWKAGRIWVIIICEQSLKPGASSCLTGGCAGGLLCDPDTGTCGPVTLTEFTFDGLSDWTDVSLVDGFNIPVRITNTGGCAVTECPVDLNPNCPPSLKGPFDASGAPVGCKSNCAATGDSASCCTESHNTAATCPASGVAFYSYFKNACPTAIAFPYDESNTLITCPSSKKVDYTVTFCP